MNTHYAGWKKKTRDLLRSLLTRKKPSKGRAQVASHPPMQSVPKPRTSKYIIPAAKGELDLWRVGVFGHNMGRIGCYTNVSCRVIIHSTHRLCIPSFPPSSPKSSDSKHLSLPLLRECYNRITSTSYLSLQNPTRNAAFNPPYILQTYSQQEHLKNRVMLGVLACMRALTSLSKPQAEQYLGNTKPTGYLEKRYQQTSPSLSQSSTHTPEISNPTNKHHLILRHTTKPHRHGQHKHTFNRHL